MSFKSISYQVPLIKQGIQECLQASAASIFAYHQVNKPFDQVKKEVPVYINSKGESLGTSIGHMAVYLIDQGLHTTIHTVDTQIFDRSWAKLNNQELGKKLRQRQKTITHPLYDANAFKLIFDGYLTFLNKGGHLLFPIIDESYLHLLLSQGPFIAIVSFNFLNQVSKYRFVANQEKPIRDDIHGHPSTHAVVVMGYNSGKFTIMDPDYEFGGIRTIPSNLLIGSIYLAETDYDAMLISTIK